MLRKRIANSKSNNKGSRKSSRNNNSKSNRRDNDNRSCNHKGKNTSMAIVHVAFKSSSQAPPAAAHAHYIARDGQYQERGGVELVESGNMPEFAQADPHSSGWRLIRMNARMAALTRSYRLLCRVSWIRHSAKSWPVKQRVSC